MQIAASVIPLFDVFLIKKIICGTILMINGLWLMAVITSSVFKITFVVAEITFKVVVITSVVAKISFAVDGTIFKVAVVTSVVAKYTFVVDEITFKVDVITPSA